MRNKNVKYNKLLIIVLIILICYYPFYLDKVLTLVNYDYLNVMGIRNAMSDQNHIEGLDIFISMGINLPIVFSIYFSCVYKKCNSKLLFILYLISFLYVFLSFSKGYYLMFFLQNLFVLRLSNVIKNKQFIILILITIFFILLSVMIRDYFVDSKLLFVMYLISPIAALDLIVRNLFSLNTPSNTILIPIYQILNLRIDQSKSEFYTNLEEPTNVFTIFGSYYNDLGFYGVLIIFMIYGFFSAYVYKKAIINRSQTFLFMYSWICYGVTLSFFSDGLMGSAPTFLKYLLIFFFLNLIVHRIKFFK